MNKITDILNQYLLKVDEVSKSSLNLDQKELIKEILKTISQKENITEELLQNVYQLLIQRVKIGFTFDAAPAPKVDTVAYLKKNEELSFKLNDSDLEHTLIIGENYDALKNLLFIEGERERERESVNARYDVIYIDPPYNTEKSFEEGNVIANDKESIKNNKFVYRDKFSRNGWLNMMNERLNLAKQLLSEEGVIFVSIDDNEHAYLKILMDEIFGEDNFIANLIWQKKNEGSAADSTFVRTLTEYIVMYAKNSNSFKVNSQKLDVNDGSYKFKDKHFKERGLYKLKNLDMSSLSWSKDLDYEIFIDGKYYYPGKNKEDWIKRHNGIHAKKDWRWRWSKTKYEWGLKNDFIEIKNGSIYSKQYQFVNNNDDEIERKQKFTNLIMKEYGSKGTSDLKSIFDAKVFDHPKPVNLIKKIVDFHPNKNARVLDFFAGSGTTGHAVMELNQEDQGKRSFTLVTNNENNIAKDITYERLYRINLGKGTKGQTFEWTNKKKPFSENLNIYEISYLDLSLDNENKLDLLLEEINKMLENFKIKITVAELENVISKLRSLNPLNNEGESNE